MITCIHPNPEENHRYDFLLLSTITDQQQKTRLEAMEKEKSLRKNLELRLDTLKLRHISALEIKRSKRSSKKGVKESKENEYMSDHYLPCLSGPRINLSKIPCPEYSALIYKTLQVKALLGPNI